MSFALLTTHGRQFVAYYDAERRLTVAGRRLDEPTWTYVRPDGVPVPNQGRLSNVVGWDSHNYLALACDCEGCLHLSGNMHCDPLVYYRTARPFDLLTLERIDRMTGHREQECTYPVFFNDAGGRLIFRYRDGGSGRGGDLYNRYDPTSRTWRPLLDTPLLDGGGDRNAYAIYPTLGPDKRFHLAWVWRDTPDCATNHTLSYARSRDLVHWETSDGKSLVLPITIDNGEVIDGASPGGGLMNMTFNLGFDARHRPVVVYHRYDARNRSQVYAARPGDRGGWEVRQISRWDFRWPFSGEGSVAAEVTVGAPRPAADREVVVDFWTQDHGAGRWILNLDTLEPVAELPPAPTALPASAVDASAGMEVQTVVSRDAGRRWVLRWETLPRHRDRPQAVSPPPTELHLHETEDDHDASTAARIGS